MRVKTSFVNAKREKVLLGEITTKESSFTVNSMPRQTRLDKSNDLLVNGALTIYCEIESFENRKSLSGETAHSRYRAECLQGIAPLHLHGRGAFQQDG